MDGVKRYAITEFGPRFGNAAEWLNTRQYESSSPSQALLQTTFVHDTTCHLHSLRGDGVR